MPTIDIPADPSEPGRISVSLQLGVADVQSITEVLRQALYLAQLDPAGGKDRADISQMQHHKAEQAAVAPHPVQSAQTPPASAAYSGRDAQDSDLRTHAALDNAQHLATSESHHSSLDQGVDIVQPATGARPRAWAVPQHAEQALQQDKNSSQDWPTTQQAQAQPQRYNQATYGSPAGEDSVRDGSKVAGKQQMASRGFSVPIQITRMEWGEPRPNAQDTWGKEEPQPQPLPSAMPAEARPSVRRAVQPTAFPPGAQLSGNTQQDLQPAPRARPAVTTHWQRMWTTDSLDHTGDDVRACLHVAKMPGLVDESGGAGWLITASNNMLNLWRCTCIGSPGEPALQLVHSLETEFQVADLQIDPANNLLMAAARDTKALTECVALHHLKMSPGIFRLKGRLGVPVGVTGRLAKNTGAVKALQVQSVHSHQGVLAGCCAASHDRTIAVFPSNVVAGELAKHKAVWKAHGRTITVLHANPHCPTLLSGDEAGTIYIWNMRSKPSEPEAEVRHDRAVTGIHSTGERSFVSCSLDGRVCVWDFNHGRRPLMNVSAPDGGPVIKMAVRGDSLVAFCTPTGLYVVNVKQRSPVQTVAVNQSHESPSLSLAWNTGSSGQKYLYANNGASISAYRASELE